MTRCNSTLAVNVKVEAMFRIRFNKTETCALTFVNAGDNTVHIRAGSLAFGKGWSGDCDVMDTPHCMGIWCCITAMKLQLKTQAH
jgi:uncharacterized cupin superfamily protein